MTGKEKQKAIDALKISVPITAMTREEFNDYIQTLNKIMDWLEQGTVLDKIREEIENHRIMTECIDPYDLVGGCLDIIDSIINRDKTESEG